jgi:hypothetical protein
VETDLVEPGSAQNKKNCVDNQLDRKMPFVLSTNCATNRCRIRGHAASGSVVVPTTKFASSPQRISKSTSNRSVIDRQYSSAQRAFGRACAIANSQPLIVGEKIAVPSGNVLGFGIREPIYDYIPPAEVRLAPNVTVVFDQNQRQPGNEQFVYRIEVSDWTSSDQMHRDR